MHVTAFAPTQLPDWQLSVWVHALPSLHEAPFGFAGFEQMPVAGLHVPTSWHWSEATHVTGVPGRQLPVALHVSLPLHALPSEQLVPTGTGVCTCCPCALQVSMVQVLPSSQELDMELTHPIAGLVRDHLESRGRRQ